MKENDIEMIMEIKMYGENECLYLHRSTSVAATRDIDIIRDFGVRRLKIIALKKLDNFRIFQGHIFKNY
jgi:hypothetical protein